MKNTVLNTAKVQRASSHDKAKQLAQEKNLYFDLSVFGGWYVGTQEELKKVGCPSPEKP